MPRPTTTSWRLTPASQSLFFSASSQSPSSYQCPNLHCVSSHPSRPAQIKFTDARVKLCSEVITGIKAIKLYAWEGPYVDRIMDLRDNELRQIRKTQALSMFNTAMCVAECVCVCVCYVCCVCVCVVLCYVCVCVVLCYVWCRGPSGATGAVWAGVRGRRGAQVVSSSLPWSLALEAMGNVVLCAGSPTSHLRVCVTSLMSPCHRHLHLHRHLRFMSGPVLVGLAAFGTFAGMGYNLTAAVAFPALALFNLLRFPIIMLPSQVRRVLEENGSPPNEAPGLLTDTYQFTVRRVCACARSCSCVCVGGGVVGAWWREAVCVHVWHRRTGRGAAS